MDMRPASHFGFIILSILFQAVAVISLKYAAVTPSAIPAFYVLSLFFLFLQALVWQQALRRYPLSFAYPFMSLVYFILLFSSALFFQEGITGANILGLILISLGITVLAQRSGIPL